FERVNTGGTLLKAQEIRNCIYAGPFNDFIIKLNEYPIWKKFITNKTSESHLQDVELILRFFALLDNKDGYKRPMKDFLSTYMGSVRYMSNNDMNQKEIVFKKTVDAIYSSLGEKPFHIKNGLNSAVFDSVMLAFANNLDNIPKDIKDKFQKLCHNQEYYKYCGKSVGDVSSVKNRIQMANDFLFGKVCNINMKVIKLYELPVSAGNGNFIMDEFIPYKEVFTSNRKADFALKISGDSMEPEFSDGYIILVKKQQILNNGQIGIFIYDGEVRCKKLYKNKKRVALESLNKKYPPLDIASNRKLDILGLVIGTYTSEEDVVFA